MLPREVMRSLVLAAGLSFLSSIVFGALGWMTSAYGAAVVAKLLFFAFLAFGGLAALKRKGPAPATERGRATPAPTRNELPSRASDVLADRAKAAGTGLALPRP